MATLDEISSCPKANHDFFSQLAKGHLVCYREQLATYGREHGFTKLSRHGFRLNMKHRREQEFLDK